MLNPEEILAEIAAAESRLIELGRQAAAEKAAGGVSPDTQKAVRKAAHEIESLQGAYARALRAQPQNVRRIGRRNRNGINGRRP